MNKREQAANPLIISLVAHQIRLVGSTRVIKSRFVAANSPMVNEFWNTNTRLKISVIPMVAYRTNIGKYFACTLYSPMELSLKAFTAFLNFFRSKPSAAKDLTTEAPVILSCNTTAKFECFLNLLAANGAIFLR
ncbi:hypothetical protein ES705_43982 [subsurface metagenome]